MQENGSNNSDFAPESGDETVVEHVEAVASPEGESVSGIAEETVIDATGAEETFSAAFQSSTSGYAPDSTPASSPTAGSFSGYDYPQTGYQQSDYAQGASAYPQQGQYQQGQYQQTGYDQSAYPQGGYTQQGYGPTDPGYAQQQYQYPQAGYAQQAPAGVWSPKNKLAAGLFGILLGTFGVHNFYLGFTGKAVAQLLITLLSFGVLAWASAIWGLVEGILILASQTGSKWDLDAQNLPMKPVGQS